MINHKDLLIKYFAWKCNNLKNVHKVNFIIINLSLFMLFMWMKLFLKNLKVINACMHIFMRTLKLINQEKFESVHIKVNFNFFYLN